MPVPQVEVKLSVRLLRQNTDPVPAGEVEASQFMLIFASGEYSPFERALRPADGVDGLFGPRTDERVRRFQAGEGLAVDGVVGSHTWTALLDRWTAFRQAD